MLDLNEAVVEDSLLVADGSARLLVRQEDDLGIPAVVVLGLLVHKNSDHPEYHNVCVCVCVRIRARWPVWILHMQYIHLDCTQMCSTMKASASRTWHSNPNPYITNRNQNPCAH